MKSEKILLSAPTACAAQVIGGGTWQSNFPLPVKHLNRTELKGTRLAAWREKLRGYEIYVLDEMSMASGDLMGWWMHLLKVIHNCDEPCGGKLVVLSGDHGQLPPVMSLPLYSDPKIMKNTAYSKAFSGHFVYRQIKEVYILEKVERIKDDGQQLKDLVTAVRDCKIDPSEQDPIFQTLKSRFPKNLTQNERQFFQQDDVVHMWYCQEPV